MNFLLIYRHEGKFKKGPVHNFLASLRVAPKKEGTAVLSLYFPHSKFFELDAAFNVTVPTFDSCTAALRLIEKSSKDYTVSYIVFKLNKNVLLGRNKSANAILRKLEAKQ